MRKNSITPLMKQCITQSLLLLLQDCPPEEISIREIVEKAGVNRSTYYRHFRSKQDVIRYFYACRLDEYLSHVPQGTDLEQYFAGVFACFLHYKKELIMLDRLSLSHLLLDELNDRLDTEKMDAVQQLYCHYHIGGVFNSFRYWLREDMNTPPEILAKQCVQILPKDFSPRLLRKT